MFAVNYTSLRENLKSCLDKVTDDYETLVVTRKGGKNVVIISEDLYNEMIEDLNLFANDETLPKLAEAIKQIQDGDVSAHNLIEVDDE